jgi:hypothetical protein
MTPVANSARLPDRMRALQRANEVRLARSQLKRRIARGELSAAEAILEPPREANSWPLIELLASQRYWGQTRTRRFLASVQVDGRRPIGGLTDRQRRLIAAQLRPRALESGPDRRPTVPDRRATAAG